jgi:hypothetical protein
MEAAPKPDGAPEPAPAKTELPNVDSPPLSPDTEMPATPTGTFAPAIEPIAAAALATRPRLVLTARHKRHAMLAASVAFAAALSAVVGVLASGGFSTPAHPNAAGVEENKAMQQSIARLGKEITTLKAGLEQANKSAYTQIAKISERLQYASAEITGSVSAPQSTAPVPAPLPRPAPRIAAAEIQPSARPPVVSGWTIRGTRSGYVYVQNHGDIYQVVLGAPLPGLGLVQSIKRQDGRWVVATPKGIIVSLRDRRYFEDF